MYQYINHFDALNNKHSEYVSIHFELKKAVIFSQKNNLIRNFLELLRGKN